MKKLKLRKEHKILLETLSKEFGESFEDMGYIMMEKGFVFMAMVSHGNEKAEEMLNMYREQKEMKQFADFLRELWEASKNTNQY